LNAHRYTLLRCNWMFGCSAFSPEMVLFFVRWLALFPAQCDLWPSTPLHSITSSEEFAIGDECFIITYQLYRYLPGDIIRKGIILGASVFFPSLLWNLIILEDKFSQVLWADRSNGPKSQESSAMCRIENGGVTR